MAAHRYWRINITANVSGGNLSAVCELEMYESEFGPNVCAGGTPSSDSQFSSSYTAAEAFDGLVGQDEASNASSVWASTSTALPHWLRYDFGSGNDKDIQCIGIHGRRSASMGDNPTAFDVQFSDDGSSWTTLWSVSGLTWSAFEFKRLLNPSNPGASYTGSPYGSHAYWRISGSNYADDAFAVAEMEMRATVGGADQCTGGTATAQSQFSGSFTPAMAFDNNAATLWHVENGTPYAWLRYQFAAPVEVQQISLQTRPSGSPIAGPVQFAMQYSDNGTLWTTAWVQLAIPAWSLGEIKTFIDPNLVVAIEVEYDFDYEIDSGIEVEYDFDYGITSGIAATFSFDYSIQLGVEYSFDYELDTETSHFYDRRGLTPADTPNPRQADRLSLPTATRIQSTYSSTPGALTPPEPPVMDSAAVGIHYNFYASYYERIWLDPNLMRLTNPRFDTPFAFGVWNAFSVANNLTAVVNNDLDGVEIVESLPVAFARYEIKDLHFQFDQTAPARLDGTFDFTFTYGTAELHIIATLVELLNTIPNEPVVEVWKWKTTISLGIRSGAEQRVALRAQPRYRLQQSVTLTDEQHRLARYRQIWSFLSRDIRMPFYQYITEVTATAALGDTKLFFDPAKTDMRDNEFLAIYDPSTGTLRVARVSTVDADGATLDAPLDAPVPEGFKVIPTVAMRIPDGSGLSMGAVNGETNINSESVQYRELVRPDSDATITMYDSMPVLHLRPIAVDALAEDFEQGTETIDNETALPEVTAFWSTPFILGNRSWKIDRVTDMDYWREIAMLFNGMQKPWLLPTWRDDLPLTEPPELGANVLETDQTDYAAYFENDTYKRLQIETANGIVYRTVTTVVDLGTGFINIVLDTPLGSNPGDEEITRISYLNKVRLASDEIELRHFQNHTIVSLIARSINE